ncbi:MAG TPA: pseudouridine-5'-phosphate glycosidase [Oscillospiraceae bacterium]|nr:pseudouridine-5'-phosphate glycosidase [Oscillospiraceae bacterium]HRW57066.1 pseudouridine-5'-phosphate glycosidase [Oscillospiraceae bacterium]
MNTNPFLELSPEVESALRSGKPVVALESSTICHTMPYPRGAETVKKAQELIRGEGVTPAAIAILEGKMRIGLSDKEIDYLGRCGTSVAKVSVKDLPVFAAKSMDGATDLAATMKIAKMAGIKLLAAGGIGGVHVFPGEVTDVPAEIEELGRTDMLVVCSGCIQDQGRTLEYLEGRGVTVVGFGTGSFPAFYTAESDTPLEYRLDSAPEVAKAFRAKETLGIESSVLVLNPVPAGDAMGKSVIDRAMGIAGPKADELGLRGKDRMPFLLALIKEMTGGMGLDTNAALLLNNARAAAQIGYLLSAIAEIDGAGNGKGFDPAAVLRIRNDIAEEIGTGIAKDFETFRSEFRAEIEEMLSAFEPASPEPAQELSESEIPQPASYRPAYTPSPALSRAPSYAPPEPEPEPQPVVYSEVPHAPTPSAIANFKPQGQMVEEREKEAELDGDYRPTEYNPKNFGKNKEETALEPASEESAMQEPEIPPVPEKKSARAKKPAAEEPVVQELPAEEPAVTEPEPAPEAEAEEERSEETAGEEPAAGGSSGEDEYQPTDYNPANFGKHENEEQPDKEEVGTTAYDPEFYRKRSEERKHRIAAAAGEERHKEEEKGAEPEYVDCKGPLEFTGEHPWAWKCTRCGQLFQKHELPHKRVKLPEE